MNWYLQSGKDSDVVLSTRIRFLRNIEGFPFYLKDKKQLEEMQNKIKDNKGGYPSRKWIREVSLCRSNPV